MQPTTLAGAGHQQLAGAAGSHRLQSGPAVMNWGREGALGSGLWAWALGSLPVAPAAPGLPVGLAASTARRARGQLWSSRASSSSFEPLLYRQREAETDTALCFLPGLSVTPTEQATHLKVINASRVLTTRLKWTAGCRITGVKKQNSLKFHNSPESSQMCLLLR